jgi:hypothetical protein
MKDHTVLTHEERQMADRLSIKELRSILPTYINNRRNDFKGIREIKDAIRILEEGLYGR